MLMNKVINIYLSMTRYQYMKAINGLELQYTKL